MKPLKYKSGAIRIIQVITMVVGLQIIFFSTAIIAESHPANKVVICVTCNNSVSVTQKGVLSEDMRWLAPTTPAEAAFSDETADTKLDLAQTSAEEISFEGEPESINSSVMEFLAPTTPPEANFND